MNNQVLSLVLHSFETDSRVLRACSSLIGVGFRVKVVALHEGQLPLRQTIGELEVERVRLWTRKGPKWRPFQFVKYFEWCVRVAWNFRRFGIIHCNDLNTLPAGILLKLISFGKARVVYDAHEFESNHKAGQSKLSIKMLQMLEGSLIGFADEVVTVADGIADEYARIYRIPRPTVVLNCPPRMPVSRENRFRERFRIRDDQTIFLTQGWLRPNRGIELMLDTFAGFPDDSKVLVVMGRGILQATVEAYSDRHSNIFHHPVVPPEEVLVHTASADFGVAVIGDTSFSKRHCMPNKLFEFMMAGLPVIVSDLPEMRKLVNDLDLGLVCSELTPAGLAASVNEIMDQDRDKLVANVRKGAEIYNWDVQKQVWIDVVNRVVA